MAKSPVDKVLDVVEEVGSPKRMTKLEYIEFVDELMTELQLRASLVQGELDDLAESGGEE